MGCSHAYFLRKRPGGELSAALTRPLRPSVRYTLMRLSARWVEGLVALSKRSMARSGRSRPWRSRTKPHARA